LRFTHGEPIHRHHATCVGNGQDQARRSVGNVTSVPNEEKMEPRHREGRSWPPRPWRTFGLAGPKSSTSTSTQRTVTIRSWRGPWPPVAHGLPGLIQPLGRRPWRHRDTPSWLRPSRARAPHPESGLGPRARLVRSGDASSRSLAMAVAVVDFRCPRGGCGPQCPGRRPAMRATEQERDVAAHELPRVLRKEL
jgi:hypothetical protein